MLMLTSRKESGSVPDDGTHHGPDMPELDGSHSSQSTPTSSDDRKFTLSPKLLIELRRMIWFEAADQVKPQAIKFIRDCGPVSPLWPMLQTETYKARCA
jgi:hypothetical protein